MWLSSRSWISGPCCKGIYIPYLIFAVTVVDMEEQKLPRLRQDISIFPATLREERVFVVSDPLGLSSEPAIIAEANAVFLSMFNGESTVRDLQLKMMHMRGNVLVMEEEVKRFLAELDSFFLLDTERYRKARDKAYMDFAALHSRPLHHGGKSYPKDRQGFTDFMDDLFQSAEGAETPSFGSVRALIVPHIDLKIGNRAYVGGYSRIRGQDFNRVLLLCTGHYLGDYFFSLTEKDYETPLGPVRTDKESVKFLGKGMGKGLCPLDFPHQMEHSAEFQTLFLKYLFPDRDFMAVPVLCGSFGRVLPIASRASDVPGIRLFIDRLSALLAGGDGKWLVIAGVDLSHVGPKFGHDSPARYMDGQFREHDRILLNSLKEGDPVGFFHELKKVEDRYNVCGASPLSLLLELFEGEKTEVLEYDVWYDEPTMSAVSFASAALVDA